MTTERDMLELRQENRELKRQIDCLKKGKTNSPFFGSMLFLVSISILGALAWGAAIDSILSKLG